MALRHGDLLGQAEMGALGINRKKWRLFTVLDMSRRKR